MLNHNIGYLSLTIVNPYPENPNKNPTGNSSGVSFL